MADDQRHLFGDEQAYITWQRQQAEEEKAAALKVAQERGKRRRVKYSAPIRRALNSAYQRKWRARIYANPELHEAHKANRRAYNREYQRLFPERHREYQLRYREKMERYVKESERRYRLEHREERRAADRARYAANVDVERQRNREYKCAHPEYWQTWNAANHEKLLGYNRKYKLAHREEINARLRASRAAKKAAKQAAEASAQEPDTNRA